MHSSIGLLTATALLAGVSAAVTTTLGSKVLILARSDADVASTSPGLDGYGIPWEAVLVPKAGVSLPQLNSTVTDGNYAAIITVSGLIYDYGTDKASNYHSALTPDQWNQLYAYQDAFRVRMVRVDEFPSADFGTTTYNSNGNGCCKDGVNAGMSLVNTAAIPAAGLKDNAPVNMDGLYHYQAKITNTTTTTAWAMFEPAGGINTRTVGAVVNKVNNRETLVWFTSLASEWSLASSYLQHSYIHWMTRSLFVGKRKLYLTPQVDDLQLYTTMFEPKNKEFKIDTKDLDVIVSWQKDINKRMPPGSDFRLEFGHNGNGNIEAAADNKQADKYCNPQDAVEYPDQIDTAVEFVKPMGTGTDIWPPKYVKYGWSDACSKLDPFANWFRNPDNLNAFGHISHTFTHEGLNNATYYDTAREIQFNQAWMAQMGIDKAIRFTADGIIPPAITGMHNGDAIRAWMDNGIKYVVGDNTRPVLRNSISKYWPLQSTVETNGYAGLWIMPRFSTEMYFDCATSSCVLHQYTKITKLTRNYAQYQDLIRSTNVQYLLNLQADPYMFHQANMRSIDQPTITVGNQTGKLSLLQTWVEVVVQELMRLTTWPMVSQTHDEFSHYFLDRMTLDNCKPSARYTFAADGKTITAVTVSSKDNSCPVPVAVTIPDGTVATGADDHTKIDKVANEPPIVWVTLAGKPVTLQLNKPVTV
ncbi:hypothetical protein VHEMI05886 [[Torrubiella] hemipterigena]|uniref:Extracellular serine-rich protein n=1 Tax=[Torrubiella] hemipterigena TaxID=1531966 RepID=A0A0A1TI33_9HYPO|nr:hypothetical protein VHEMI05886 [[Torrubiella] hemipterigena]